MACRALIGEDYCNNITKDNMKYCIFHDDIKRRKWCQSWVNTIKPKPEHAELKYDQFPKEEYQEWFNWVHNHNDPNKDDSYQTVFDIFSYEYTENDKNKIFYNCVFLKSFGIYKAGDRAHSIGAQLELFIWDENNELVEHDSAII
jgi:hypothetical protein